MPSYPPEPFRIKVVESIRLPSRAEREAARKSGGSRGGRHGRSAEAHEAGLPGGRGDARHVGATAARVGRQGPGA